MRGATVLLVAAALAVAAPAWAQVTDDRPLPPPVPYPRAGALLANPTDAERTLDVETIHLPGARWIRVYFGEVELGPGSYVRIGAERDGEVQELDAAGLAAWRSTSGYFNGDTVRVELVGGPRTLANRLVIDQVAYEVAPPIPTTLCGEDDRVPSQQHWAGRVQPSGCSGAVWSQAGCIITAGHCASGAQMIEFMVPLNDASCDEQHPPIADQFPIVAQDASNAGVGDDWAVGKVGPNSLGQTPFERYGLYRPMASTPPVPNDPLSVTGYGTAAACDLTHTQQVSYGVVTGVTATAVAHNSDTTGGNSGSGIVRDGRIIAVHTHGGCPSNDGTRVDRPDFAVARVEVCYGGAGDVDLDRPSYGCGDVLSITLHDASLVGAGSQGVTVESTTEPGGETVALSEVLPGMLVGTIVTEDATPPLPGDGQLTAEHGAAITVRYVDQDDGAGGSAIREATAVTDCLAPVIGGVLALDITAVSALVSWTTDEPSDSAVHYGIGSPTDSVADPLLVTDHGVLLEGLTPCTDYVFTVRSADLAGNVALDDNSGSFHAFQSACPMPPRVPDGSAGTDPVRLSRLPNGGIAVSWDNQCLATGETKLLYGPLAQVSSYTLAGAVCGIDPAAASAPWAPVALGDLWVLVVKDDAFDVEGSWGEATAGERNGALASGACGTELKNPIAKCP